jgi:hypothetical protein
MACESIPNELSIPAALIRLYWFLIGNVLLVILAVITGSQSKKAILFPSVMYWAVVVSLMVTRYIDIRYGKDSTADGQPFTLRHWVRYSVFILILSSGMWGVAILAAYFIGK